MAFYYTKMLSAASQLLKGLRFEGFKNRLQSTEKFMLETV